MPQRQGVVLNGVVGVLFPSIHRILVNWRCGCRMNFQIEHVGHLVP
jgi:hypothetical protein